MQRAASFNILTALKEIITVLTKEEPPLLPLHEKSKPVFQLHEIVVTPEPSPTKIETWNKK
jgi:hypothetical protein